ncbi:MAG: D-tyrosyl-tRNA(Tyr) deacylase [Saprospiraceae bacterium]|nr:D-tyrosyl-tRNA(Tyr) deacylase [Saprospiraceae bacterium]
MRTVIQRVTHASVSIAGELSAKINQGLLVLLAVESEDNDEDIAWLCRKIVNLRIFADENDLMNKSLNEIGGELLVVSQFTLFASTRKGNRPSFIKSANPTYARQQYEKFITIISGLTDKKIQSGVFAENMKVDLSNDGPVTIIIDSKIRE